MAPSRRETSGSRAPLETTSEVGGPWWLCGGRHGCHDVSRCAESRSACGDLRACSFTWSRPTRVALKLIGSWDSWPSLRMAGLWAWGTADRLRGEPKLGLESRPKRSFVETLRRSETVIPYCRG